MFKSFAGGNKAKYYTDDDGDDEIHFYTVEDLRKNDDISNLYKTEKEPEIVNDNTLLIDLVGLKHGLEFQMRKYKYNAVVVAFVASMIREVVKQIEIIQKRIAKKSLKNSIKKGGIQYSDWIY
jgi:hypothetical protein